MVTSVLDLTQLQSGDFEVLPERVELASVVQRVNDANRLEAESNGNEIVVDVPEGLVGVLDRRMVHSILFNLVANACKYTRKGRVRIVARSLSGGNLRIQVEDSGIGMTERQISEAFQPFRQADGSFTRRYDGSGLGLAVVRGFAEAMGGVVRITSELGKGATVVVELPREVQERQSQGVFDEDEPTMLLR
jgi:signal transduction histidine kinase